MKMNNSLARGLSADGGADEREQLLNEHLGLVHFIARQVARGLPADTDFDELVSAGTIGLMAAHESFESERGLAFSTFAAPRIRGSILDELRRQDHVPRSVRRKAREIGSARDSLRHELGREPNDREVAARLGVEVDVLWRWDADVEGASQLSLDQSPSDGNDNIGVPLEMMAQDETPAVEEELTREREAELMREALLELKEQERVVLSLYYFEELKLHEIATVLGLTESRVSQIRTKALGRLRERLAGLRR